MCGLLLQPDSEGEFIYTLSVQRFWDVCGAPSCSVCHWDLFLLEIFRTWTSRGWSPLLPVEGGAGRFPRPHPTTLWWLCPSRLRAGWLLANFAWNVPLASLIFLKRSLVFPILLFSSISLHWSLRPLISPCYSLKLFIQMGISSLCSFAFSFSSFLSYL